MSNLNSAAFFRLWEEVHAASNPGRRLDRWETAGVTWTRDRHSYYGASHAMQLEVHRMSFAGTGGMGWEVLVVTERWWEPTSQKVIRNTSWSRLLRGQARSVFAWLKRQSDGYVARSEADSIPGRQ